MITYFRHQVSNNHHLMARSYGRGEGSSAYGPKMHESLPYPLKTGRTNGRRAALLRALRDAEIAHTGTSTIDPESDEQLTDAQIQTLFEPNIPLRLPPNGIFLSRVRNLIGERGL
jgi:hypothetical protein